MEWISVKDKLPKDDGLYLVYGKIYYNEKSQNEYCRVMKYINNKWHIDFNPCAYVTHWIDIPEAPK